MPPIRLLLSALVAASLVILAQGCDSGTPTFDTKASYTPDSLAQEFLFRYRDIGSPSAAKEAEKKAPEPDRKEAAAAKQAPVSTLTGLLEDIAAKVHMIREGTAEENAKKVIDEIAKAPNISEGDKALIAEKLRSMVKARE